LFIDIQVVKLATINH